MELGKALDSCYIAAYRIVEGLPKADVVATFLLILALSGYVVDMAVTLNMMGLLPILGVNEQTLLFMGCLLCGMVGFDFLSRAQKLINDTNLKSSKYQSFRYAFFFTPVATLIMLIFSSMTYGIRLK
jgi:hypothetical protein